MKTNPILARSAAAALIVLGTAVPTLANEFGDPEEGRNVFKQCRACHEVGADAFNRTGPHLNEIFGRKAGGVEGFAYSEGLTRMGRDGLVWDFDTLDRYIENPLAFASHTSMEFEGVKDEGERADLLAYLRDFSASPANIPSAAPTATATDPDAVDPDDWELSEEILAIQGDKDWGEYLSSECTTCHQLDGDYDGIPPIISWPEDVFVIAMHSYKEKIRPHPVMQMMAGKLSNDEIAALAAYFGSIEYE